MEGFVGRFARGGKMSKINIDKMVDRFLGWRLPDDFAPDGSISFNHAPDAMGHEPTWPTGTNLLTAVQAKQMFSEVVQPDEEMLELMEGTANMLRGMLFDDGIPERAKSAMRSRIAQLEAAVESRID
jgi:hypothetical protein